MIKYEDILKKIKYYEDRKAKNDEKLAQLNEENLTLTSTLKLCKRQVICWIENHIKKIDNYIEN